MYRAIFELIGAFVFWCLAGFKGKFDDFVGKGSNYKNAFLGMTMFIVLIVLIIVLIKS